MNLDKWEEILENITQDSGGKVDLPSLLKQTCKKYNLPEPQIKETMKESGFICTITMNLTEKEKFKETDFGDDEEKVKSKVLALLQTT
jgi:hypothetical protein